MSQFLYVYILQRKSDSERFYTGCTRELRERLRKHNAGEVSHTAEWKPWRIKTYLAFSDEVRAPNSNTTLSRRPAALSPSDTSETG